MKSKRKRLLIVVFAVICTAVIATVMLYHPKRPVVIEIQGPAREINAVFIVDGRTQTKTAILPATLNFNARRFSYVISPSHADAPVDQTWHVRVTTHAYTGDKIYDYSLPGWGTKGTVLCPNVVGMFYRCWASPISNDD